MEGMGMYEKGTGHRKSDPTEKLKKPTTSRMGLK
jgi:hypothetical protein